MLGQDNAEQRLLIIAKKADLVSEKRINSFEKKENAYKNYLENSIIKRKVKSFIDSSGKKIDLKEKVSIETVLKRTDISRENIIEISNTSSENLLLLDRAMVEIKYSGYIEKQKREVLKNKKLNLKDIPKNFPYTSISGLSNEVKEKLNKTQPTTIGAASKIEGVTPAAINLLLVYIKKAELETLDA